MPNRRQLLLSGTASAVSIALATSAQAGLSKGNAVLAPRERRVSLGLCGPAYWNGFCPFLNWQKMAGAYEVTLKNGGKISGKAVFSGGYADKASGEIAKPVPIGATAYTRVFFASAPTPTSEHGFSDESWAIKWEGTGLCTIGGLGADGTQSIDNASRSGTFRFGKRPGNIWTTFTITNINDPPRNIRIYQTRYASNVAAGQTFNPDWLGQIQNFGILRFMDWMGTNNSMISEFSQIADERYFAWGTTLTAASDFGPKGGTPLSLICQLANTTRCNIHFCIPHLATDSCVRSIATYFRDHLDRAIVTTFEYSNECWNYIFQQTAYCRSQGQAILPKLDPGAWYGYRSAQCMRIIRDVYNDRSRWRGCLATQTVNPDVTQSAIDGVKAFIAAELSSPAAIAIADLFNEISVTGYFGDIQQPSRRLDKITKSNPAVVTSPSHGYETGQRLKLFVHTGMTELNNTYATVGEVTPDTFVLEGVNSTLYKPSVLDNQNYAHPAHVFELMDTSAVRHDSDPKNFPTKYSYFNQVAARSWLNGSADGLTTTSNIASLRDQIWPAQKAIADAYGLDLRQYEGGLHYVGDIFLTGYGGNPQFTDYLIHIGHSKETAEVYAAMYSAFFQIGGHYPAKFVEAAPSSPFGTWGGMRFIPGDEGNPVWVATRNANGG